MKIIAKVPILYNSVNYKPGDELPSNNPEMTKAWKDAGTVEMICDEKEGVGDTTLDEQVLLPNEKTPDPDEAKDDLPEFYTEEQLDKLKSKSDIINYAESIGLTGLEANLHRPELIDKVLAYIEEVQQNENI
ncbi:MAG: hypothetical protein HFG35_11385 [Eubacterium sp.]|nr:hypothetical protein [Eubacterium sp.]